VVGSGGPLETTIVLSGVAFAWLLVSLLSSAGLLLLGFLHGAGRRRARTRRRQHLRPVAAPARRAGVRLEVWGLPLRVLHVCSAMPVDEAAEPQPRPARR
jgi:hypothetical protein